MLQRGARADGAKLNVPARIQFMDRSCGDRVQSVLICVADRVAVNAHVVDRLFGERLAPPASEIEEQHTGVEVGRIGCDAQSRYGVRPKVGNR